MKTSKNVLNMDLSLQKKRTHSQPFSHLALLKRVMINYPKVEYSRIKILKDTVTNLDF